MPTLPHRLAPLVTALLAVLAGAPVRAEDPLLLMLSGDEQLASLATGTPRQVSKAPSVTTVISRDDIRASGATDVDEILETVPGLHVTRRGYMWQPIYTMRGIRALANTEVLVMMNGIPMNFGFLGNRGTLMAGLPLENVSHIEVIRGPGSALYGAEAFAGVINIVTRSAEEIDGTEAGLRIGSFNSRDVWVQHGGQWDGLRLVGSIRLGHTAGHGAIIAADAQSALDSAFGTHASRAPGALNAGHDAVDARIDLTMGKWQLRAGYVGRPNLGAGAGVAEALDPAKGGNAHYVNADLTWRDARIADGWDALVQASYSDAAETNSAIALFPPGSVLPLPLAGGSASTVGMVGQPQHWESQARLNAAATYTGIQGHTIRLGAGYHVDDLYKVTESKNFTFAGLLPVCLNLDCSIIEADEANGLIFLTPHRRTAYHAYGQDEWQLGADWTLTTGLRHDHYSDFGSTTNPRVALVWAAAYNVTARFMAGRAFRAPSFVELYVTNNPVQTGNPQLRPETIETKELAFNWQVRPNLRTAANLFHYRMKDAIRFVANSDPTTGSTAQNVGRQRGRGLEMEFAWDPSAEWRLVGNYAFQHSVDDSTQQHTAMVPRHHAYLRADWRMPSGWTLSTQVNSVAGRQRAAPDTRASVADYVTTDLVLRSARILRDFELSLSLRNLFDVDAREPSEGPSTAGAVANIPGDLPLPRRNVYLELRYTR